MAPFKTKLSPIALSPEDLALASEAQRTGVDPRSRQNVASKIEAALRRIGRSHWLSHDERVALSKQKLLEGARLGYKLDAPLREAALALPLSSFEAALQLGAQYPKGLQELMHMDSKWISKEESDDMFERARLLLLYGADVNRQDQLGESVLLQACRLRASGRVFELLSQWGADWDAPCKRGATPRSVARERGVAPALAILEASELESALRDSAGGPLSLSAPEDSESGAPALVRGARL